MALARDGACLYGWKYPNGRCVHGVIHPHHMKTRGSGGDDSAENIISLCPYHHDLAQSHSIPIEILHAIMTELYGYSYVCDDRG